MLQCAGGILKNEGPLAFYKVGASLLMLHLYSYNDTTQGTVSPLVGIGACVSIQFGALEYTKRMFAERNRRAGIGGSDGTAFLASQLVLAGSAAGIANSVVSGPVEHIRIRERRLHCHLRKILLLIIHMCRAANPAGT